MTTDEARLLRTRQVLASPRRVELLELLRTADGPVTVLDAAAALGLHPNTARIHLDQLVEVGLAEQVTERRSEPGRPRALYVATDETPADEPRRAPVRDVEDYKALATVLAQGLAATDDPAAAALAAGEGWVEALAAHDWPPRPTTAEVAAAELESLLDELGFDPEMHLERGEVTLHRCPFADVARSNVTVVCGVHLGMVRRALDRLDSPLRAARLEPFTSEEPLACRLTLTTVEPEEGGVSPLPVLGANGRRPSPRTRPAPAHPHPGGAT